MDDAFGLIDIMRQFKIEPSIVFYTNLMHNCFKNKKTDQAEVAWGYMINSNIKRKIFLLNIKLMEYAIVKWLQGCYKLIYTIKLATISKIL